MKREANINQLAERVKSLVGSLQKVDPLLLASRTGTTYISKEDCTGKFDFSFWGQPLSLSFPDFVACAKQTGENVPLPYWAMIAYYFVTSDGTPLAGKWVSFSELPDGRFYNQAFQGYTGTKLSRTFNKSFGNFERAAESAGGNRIVFGNIAYSFHILPKVDLSVVCWKGDEDFPPSFQVLFDASIDHHLPTDACAILGSMLTGKLIKAKGD
jgi:hypothetical protein